MNRLKLIFIVCSIYGLVGCSPGHVQIDATVQNDDCKTTKTWATTDFPLVINVPPELNSYKSAFDNSSANYKNVFNKDVFNFVFNDSSKANTQWTKSFDSLNDNYFGIFKMLTWNFESVDKGVLAFTGTLTKDCTRIIHADILFNFANFSFGDTVLTPNDSQLIDYESVLTHELGHFIGLSHVQASVDPSSVMNPSISKGYAKRAFSNNDVSRIKALYNLK